MDKKTEKLIEKATNPPSAPVRRGPISRLRKEITKVNTLTTPAVENLKRHLEGEKVDKELVASSKWALETLVSFYNAAAKEEQVRNARAARREASKAEEKGKKADKKPEPIPQQEKEDSKGGVVAPVRFSLTRD